MQPNVDPRQKRAEAHLLGSAAVKQQVSQHCLDSMLAAAGLIVESFQGGGKLLLCGNGGSAADCQHLAAEFTNRLTAQFERPGLPAIALTTDTSFLTAYANDYEFATIFSRQVQALGRAGDVLFGISTSGNSENVIQAAQLAQAIGLKTILLTGCQGRMLDMGDVVISVPSENPQHVQEAHLAIEHVVCDLVEQTLFGELT